jgi:methyl-accepting chemotaxis protein
MGGGKNIMLKEISVPIRVNGRHWGCFQTVWTPHPRGAAAS